VRSAGTSVIARNEAMTFVTDFKVNGKQSIKAKEMLAAWLSGKFGLQSEGTSVIARKEAISSYDTSLLA
jgi:hypothetical protein